MMHTLNLTDRQKFLLTLVIHEYTREAAPISSNHLVKECGLTMSSATVRNELAELTNLGFLRQPLRDLCISRLPKRYRFDPVQDIQVLTPMHKGEVGAQQMTMERMDSNTAQLIKKVKGFLDPNAIMNPGNWEID